LTCKRWLVFDGAQTNNTIDGTRKAANCPAYYLLYKLYNLIVLTLNIERLQMENRVININPEILGGTPVFYGTRVPVKNLFDYLETGESIDEFLADFEGCIRNRW
jgi:uncharacterized protein (DUF433 family)